MALSVVVLKRKHRLWFSLHWVVRIVDLRNVRELEWVELLAVGNSGRCSLGGVGLHLSPEQVAGNGKDVVGVVVGQVDACGLQKLLSGEETLRGELVVTEGAKQLTH